MKSWSNNPEYFKKNTLKGYRNCKFAFRKTEVDATYTDSDAL